MTEPLTPPDCDLTDFPFMPLEVARLRDSELASNETPEACWAAVLLWAASWHQVPAASVPDDDKWLAKAAGYGRVVKEWARVRTGALRGFELCSDGRLYHAVVAEKARESWLKKLKHRWASECARIKKHNERHGTSIAKPTFEEWETAGRPAGHPLFVPGDKPESPDAVTGETASKGEREGQGERDSYSDLRSAGAAAPPAVDKSTEQPTARALAVSWLTKHRVEAGDANAFLNTLAKDYGTAVAAQACAEAVAKDPIGEAKAFLGGIARRLANPVTPTVPSADADKTAAYLAAQAADRAPPPGAKVPDSVREARAKLGRVPPPATADDEERRAA